MKKTKDELINIFSNTVECINSGGYENMKGEFIDFEHLQDLREGSRLIGSISKQESKYDFPETRVTVENKDSFQKAAEFGEDCLVLNMASPWSAGGGVENGSRAQEEELCRRSTLSYGLFRYSDKKYKYYEDLEKPEKYHYPIPKFGAIYCPDVEVFKSVLSYNPIDTPFTCSVVSVAAIKNPILDKETGELSQEDAQIMSGKIRTILRVGVKYSKSKLVLGALGCGAYHNPASNVARLFKSVLEEPEFTGCFSDVCFAIIEDHNSGSGNFKPFYEVWKKS